ncbi:OLC1v1015907C1 [Oldenlandia corymbosa var. corymbosa]|uniref:OLC1v1015907C1 n=1 Tax=Oldenlandia corymbosa var. corymbosa TaxID=529605 RepID=A0AAV1E6G5_OLDCO|nr:OLC1v1015907C1 [Oldenlandia corymbosa var. corymbosa]
MAGASNGSFNIFPGDLTIVLVGSTGSGKSATGNSILGKKNAFKSVAGFGRVTSTTERKATVLEDGLFDGTSNREDIEKEIVRSIQMSKDGLHAVLLVLSLKGRFSEEQVETVETLKHLFGDRILDYMIVTFTGGDQLEEDDTLDEFLGRSCPPALQDLLEDCGNRKIVFNNRAKDEETKAQQRQQLLDLIANILVKNGGKPYTHEIYEQFKKETAKRVLTSSKEKINTPSEDKELEQRLEKMVKEKMSECEATIKKYKEELEKLQKENYKCNTELQSDYYGDDESWKEIEHLADDGAQTKVLPNTRKKITKEEGSSQARQDENDTGISVSKTKRKEKNQLLDGDENDPAILVSRTKGKGKFQLRDEDENYPGILMSTTKRKGKNQLCDGDGKDPAISVSRTKRKGKNHLLDGDENDPVVLVSGSKGKGKFKLRDEDENNPAIPLSSTKQKEIQILVEYDDEDFPIIRVSRTRQKGNFHILDKYEGEDVLVTTAVDGEAQNVVAKAKALPCEYCQMPYHRTAQCPQEELPRWLEKETSHKEYSHAADSGLKPRVDCSGNLDKDEWKDHIEESSKGSVRHPDGFVNTVMGHLNMENGKKNNGQPEDAGTSVIVPKVASQRYEDPNNASPAMETVSKRPPTRKKKGRCSKVSEENLGPTFPQSEGCDGDREADDIRPRGENLGQNLENNPDNSFKLGVGWSRKARYRMNIPVKFVRRHALEAKEAARVEGPVEATDFWITTTSDNRGSTVHKKLSGNWKKLFEGNLIQENQPVQLTVDIAPDMPNSKVDVFQMAKL